MKKAYATIAIFLWLIALTTSAQNMYRNYSSPINVPRPTSAVSVVHSNGNVYLFQADENGKLSATEIDPLSMNPTGNDNGFVINQQGYIIHLNGSFEDASGDFVLFGYRLQYPNVYLPQNPAYIKILSDFSSCDVFYEASYTGEFTAGCDGYNQNMQEAYMFVNGEDLVAVDPTNPSIMNYLEPNQNDFYTDISWDRINYHFIASGSARNSPTGHEDPFVEVLDLLNFTSVYSIAEYYICDPTVTHSSEYKSLHVQLDDNNLILYHDLERYDNSSVYDIIWLTRIKNFWDVNTVFVDESWFYELPNAKLFAKDLIYDSKNNRLDFLGEFNKCREGTIQLLAQVDPYLLSSGIEIGQLGATFMGGTCLNDQPPYEDIAYNDLKMSNLVLNIYNPCYPILIAGVEYGKQSVLTETYDISLSLCDKPIWHEDKPASPSVIPYSHNITSHTSGTPVPTNVFPDIIIMTYLCDEPDACSHQFGGKSLQKSLTNNPTAEISIEYGKLFVCEGFEGVIQYSLYDMAGKLLQQGETQNGKYSSLILPNGVYLLKATDATGRQMVKKVVLY